MKAIATLLPLAAAVAPPRIELDLSAMSNAYKLANPVTRSHDLGYTQTDGSAVMSRQDWTERCPAGAGTDETNCPFPEAKAWDHQDQHVSVTTRVKLVDLDGVPQNVDVNQVNFAQRSTYLFRYDAHDAAGNRAEQVIFALILDDKTAPQITMCGGESETVEAASDWVLCSGSIAVDNIDNTVPITYSIQAIDGVGNAVTTTNPGPTTMYGIGPGSNGVFLGRDMTYAQARTRITTNDVGRWLVTLCAKDNAGVYGTNSADNSKCLAKAVVVKDTRPPIINIHGANPLTHECATTYTDAGATITDLLDTVAQGKNIQPTVVSNVDSATLTSGTAYEVSYNAQDAASNPAVEQVRDVYVTDTTNPVIALIGDGQMTHHSGNAREEPGVTCTDTCDASPSFMNSGSPITTWSRPWDDKVLGDYIATYTCTDSSGNSDEITRKYMVADVSKPTITVLGGQDITIEASPTLEYVDQGASCDDYVDGVLSHAVEVSGQIVNQRIPGTYEIRYDCQDLSGNQAPHLIRKVTVEDTQCPTITLRGQSQVDVEAGFNYVDAGATATDSLDGDITSAIWTDGDTVDTASAFYKRRSCREIKQVFAGATDGYYHITTSTGEVNVWCDMTTDVASGHTYFLIENSTPAVPYTSAVQGDCASHGLKMAIFSSTAQQAAAAAKFTGLDLTQSGATDSYLCSTNDGVHTDQTPDYLTSSSPLGHAHQALSHADAGKYKIHYHVSDKAGNHECSAVCRTVTVRDTLPPVITLHLKNQLIHKSDGTQTGINGVANPANSATSTANTDGRKGNPFLASGYTGSGVTVANNFMAEEAQTSSVNGWVIGAVASAVSGLALLANSMRKTTTSTAVPV